MLTYYRRASVPLTDGGERVIGVVSSGPDDPTWKAACARAVERIEEAKDMIKAPAANWWHRRGDFLAMAYGVSYGGGQKVRRTPLCAALAYA